MRCRQFRGEYCGGGRGGRRVDVHASLLLARGWAFRRSLRGPLRVSTTTFKNLSGAYLVAVAIISSAIGGYLAARLRTKWVGCNTNEVFFRDTAHGFIAWAFATVLSASALGAAATHVVGVAG